MKMKFMIYITASLLFLAAGQAQAYWIWTPESGKWVNPKTAVKSSPQEQFAFAKSLYEAQSYAEAQREFKKLLQKYPKSFEAAESQYYLALVEEERNRPYEAFKMYQKVIDKYPFSERIQEIIQREYALAERFMTGKRTGDVPLAVENPSIEIFSKVVDNSSYGPLAAKAQYKLGLVLKGMQRYFEAEEAFNKVISNYPESEWVPAAQYQIAETRAKMSKGAAYDQAAMQEARQKFEEFIQEFPDAELSKEAESKLAVLREQEAQSNYEIGRFYEKQKAYPAAKMYYDEVVSVNPDSIWATRSRERLIIMGTKK
jgi:outer membrane protein assembly factor BamD